MSSSASGNPCPSECPQQPPSFYHCRLCYASLPATSLRSLMTSNAGDHLVQQHEDQLLDKLGQEDQLLDKLRRFLGLATFLDESHVCFECISHLDFCVGFVDRARRIEKLILEGAEEEVIHTDLEFRWNILLIKQILFFQFLWIGSRTREFQKAEMGLNERKCCRDGLGTKKTSVVSDIVGGFC